MDMTLYRVIGGQKRVALGDLADTEFYAASKDPATRIITLHPVNIVDGAAKRAETSAPGPLLDSGDDPDAPFDPNEA